MLELESMVDRVGLANVLYALAHIASAKSEHIETNWQDKLAATQWSRAARRLDTAARKASAVSVEHD